MDSAVCLAIARREGFICYSLAFDYGQRHRIELEMAQRQAQSQKVRAHLEIKVGLDAIGASALTADIPVPKHDSAGSIPNTYVPGRNTIFLSIGLALLEAKQASDLFIGANQVDFSGYPDCRGAYLEAYQRMARLATRIGVEGNPLNIRAPLLDMDKGQIVRTGLGLGVDFGHTHTCYDPSPAGLSCGLCPSCRLRLQGFAAAGTPDPLPYLQSE